ncbi:hypothetical protein Taro_031806 [Colocasia esculenta]|uniref:Endonuclease/exonuclease/phosphatase domain-containing protein n=1 Tax=Colocasia esculenta TaxID=4460 RepID=A0A843VT08_COLES|nr:hypothetical protein [Colocasia esculenta]
MNEVSGQYSACIYPPQSFTGSGLYRGHTSPDNNDGKVSPVELDSHQSGLKDHITQNKVENALLVDSCSFHVSDKVCTYLQLENQKGKEFLATSGVEVDGHDNLLPKEKDLSNEAGKDIAVSSEVMTFTESERVEIFNSKNASSQMNLHTAAELQADDRYADDSFFILKTISKHEDQENDQNFVTPENKGMWHSSQGPSHSLSEVKRISSINTSELKHASSIHMSCTSLTMQEDTDLEKIQNTSLVCYAVLPSEGSEKDVFSPENGSENSLEFKSESAKFPDNLASKSVSDEFPDDAISDTSNSQGISQPFTISVGTPLPEITETSPDLKVVQRKADLDVSVQDSYKSKPLKSSNLLDMHLDLEEFDSSVNVVQKVMKTASNGSNQLMADVHEKLPGFTENSASENVTYSNSSGRNSGNAAISTGIEIEASPSLNAEEEVNSDSSFIEELHGAGNVPMLSQGISVTSLLSQPTSPLFPDPSTNDGSGLEEVESGRLSSKISNQIQEKVYDPLLWTPMEIEAASRNAECTLLEHNLSLTSAYTEVKDYAGTKDSSGEPQITSYNRQFMGTVDYIWHSEELQTLRVLDTIPKHVLQQTLGFPTKKWGSDHLAIACEFSFKKA